MLERVNRGLVLGYILVIWVAVWPFEDVPLLGDAQRLTAGMLRRASLYAGMAVFSDERGNEQFPWAACARVRVRSQGGWEPIYAPECPRRGTLFFEDSFDETVRRMLRAADLFRLAQPPRLETLSALRNVLQLNDYFCQAKPGANRVALHWKRVLRSYKTGAFRENSNEVVCVMDCDASINKLPHCFFEPIARRSQ